jgi:hypothetical protein
MPKISEIAQVCKSKNAGPFEVTIDVVFSDKAMFEAVKATNVLSAELMGRLYNVQPSDVLFTVYDAGNAFKATLPRRIPAGDLGDTDVYGAQQHAPLLEVEIPVEIPGKGDLAGRLA